MPIRKRFNFINGLVFVLSVMILLITLTGGLVIGASRSAHEEHWRYVSTIPSLDYLENPVGRSMSLVKIHQGMEAVDIFPSHAVLFTLEKISIILPEAAIDVEHPVMLKVMAVSEQGAVTREITEWQITSDTLQTGNWLTIFESSTEYVLPEETLVVVLSCDQNMDLQIGYEVAVNIYDSQNPLLKIFLPLILK